MTKNAQAFITPMTLSAISGRPTRCDYEVAAESAMSHIELARWADVLVVAPASANSIAKYANGIADDLLSTLYLASHSPKIIAPAMNVHMWQHPATQRNVAQLQKDGVQIVSPGIGVQACGDEGEGRLEEPEVIQEVIEAALMPKWLAGLSITVTAGPTQEPLDPVRYLTNYSSGKMGYALAQAAFQMGARVKLISGPTHLKVPYGVECIPVQTAAQMYQVARHTRSNIFIGASAVADWTCAQPQPQKIKHKGNYSIECVPTPDIIAHMHTHADFIVGFAAETQDLLPQGRLKLAHKKLDMIAINQVGSPQTGFMVDTNALLVLTPHKEIQLPLASKKDIAVSLLKIIGDTYSGKNQNQDTQQKDWQRNSSPTLCD